MIQGLGVLPGPPAVELVGRGGGQPPRRFAINVQHIPISNPGGNPSGMLHIMTLAGPANDDGDDAAMSIGASYLG